MPDQREILMQYLEMLRQGQQPQIPQGVPPNVGAAAVMARPPVAQQPPQTAPPLPAPSGPNHGWSLDVAAKQAQSLASPPGRVSWPEDPAFEGAGAGFSGKPKIGEGKDAFLKSQGFHVVDNKWVPFEDGGPAESTLPLGKPEIPRKQPFERPKGEPVDPENPEHAELQQEASTRGMEKVKEALQTRDESKLSKRDKLLAMRDIAEGLGSWKPSVAADYLLTGGPPEQPTASTTTIDLDLAKEEDLRSGEDLRAALAESGIEMPKNIPLSVYREMFPMLMTQQRQEERAEDKAESARRWEETQAYRKSEAAKREEKERVSKQERMFYKWQSNTFNNSLRDRITAADETKLLFRKGSTDAEQRTGIRSLLRLSGDKRLSNVDISDMRSPWDAVGKVDNFLSRLLDAELGDNYRENLQKAAGVLEEVARRGMDQNAKDWAQGLSNATGIDYEELLSIAQPGGPQAVPLQKLIDVKRGGKWKKFTEEQFQQLKALADAEGEVLETR